MTTLADVLRRRRSRRVFSPAAVAPTAFDALEHELQQFVTRDPWRTAGIGYVTVAKRIYGRAERSAVTSGPLRSSFPIRVTATDLIELYHQQELGLAPLHQILTADLAMRRAVSYSNSLALVGFAVSQLALAASVQGLASVIVAGLDVAAFRRTFGLGPTVFPILSLVAGAE